MNKTYSLYKILDRYGFSTKEQKAALENLMHQASILTPIQSLQDKFQTKHTFDELVYDALEFVKLTQKHFTIRSGHQERWEIKPSNWMTKNQSENLLLLKTLGMTAAIKPKAESTDALCILGAMMKRIEDRIDYAALLLEKPLKTDNLFLLAGERYVTVNIDGSEEELNKIANFYQLTDLSKLTETHLIQQAYKKSALYNKIKTFVIDTPKRDLPRPTTQTTTIELIEWLKEHNDIKTITFVSNQPHVKYQEAVITEILRNQNSTLNIEVVGSDLSDANIQPAIEALGSFIFAITPNVLIQSGEKISNPELIELFKELYAKQPLVYQNLENYLFNQADDIQLIDSNIPFLETEL